MQFCNNISGLANSKEKVIHLYIMCHFLQHVSYAFYVLNAVFHRRWQVLEGTFYDNNMTSLMSKLLLPSGI